MCVLVCRQFINTCTQKNDDDDDDDNMRGSKIWPCCLVFKLNLRNIVCPLCTKLPD